MCDIKDIVKLYIHVHNVKQSVYLLAELNCNRYCREVAIQEIFICLAVS